MLSKKLLLIFTITLVSALTNTQLYAQNVIPGNPDNVLKDIQFIHTCYPRTEGSPGEKKLIGFIEKRLNLIHAKYNLYDFSESDNVYSFSSVIEVDIPGKQENTLILAIPLNNDEKDSPAYDRAVNIALGLSVIRQFLLEQPPISLKVLFLGAEFGEDKEYPMGSKLFLRDFEPTFRTAVLYLNMARIPSRLYIRGGARGIVSPYWLMEKITNALKKTDIFFLLRGNENQIFRTSLTREKTIIQPYLNAGFPSVSFAGEYHDITEEKKRDFVFAFNLFIEQLLKDFQNSFPEEWDKHYLFFQAKSIYFIIPEKLYIILFILLFVLMIGYFLIFPKRIKKYLKTIWRSSWNYPIIFILGFLILAASTFFLELIIQIKRIPDIWKHIPSLFLILKILAAIFLVSILYLPMRKFNFSKNGSFYSASAIFFLLIDVIVLALIDISYTYYFTWALAFTLLFSVTSNRYVKLLLFLISPYWILKATTELFSLKKLDFCRIVLLSHVKGNILLAILILPFVFMIIRLGLLFPPLRRRKNLPYDRTKRPLNMAITTAFPIIAIALYILFFFKPFGTTNPQPLLVTENIDLKKGKSSILITSPAPIGKLKYISMGKGIQISTRSRKYRMPTNVPEQFANYIESSSVFLDRKNYNITMDVKGKPYIFKIQIVSDTEFILYDSNFPFQRDKSGKSYSIYIGKNPPKPLTLQLTLPRNHLFTVKMEIVYKEPVKAETIIASNKKVQWIILVKDELPLKG